jgi:FixJ family two-component response regulator
MNLSEFALPRSHPPLSQVTPVVFIVDDDVSVRESLESLIRGLLNKQAAALLGISEITLQIHCTNGMRKMQAHSLAELVRMADALEIPLANVQRRTRPSVGFGLVTSKETITCW